MTTSRFFASATFLAIAIVSPSVANASVIYVSTGPSLSGIPASLGTVDVTTGAYTQIGPTVLAAGDINQLQDIALDSNGNLFGVTNTRLYGLNPSTAAAAPIGFLTGQLTNVNALAFGANNTLCASGQGELYTINTSTGAATPVGTTTNGTVTYASAGDLAFLNGMLYMTTPAAVGPGDRRPAGRCQSQHRRNYAPWGDRIHRHSRSRVHRRYSLWVPEHKFLERGEQRAPADLVKSYKRAG